MALADLPRVLAANRAEWRAWLAENHATHALWILQFDFAEGPFFIDLLLCRLSGTHC